MVEQLQIKLAVLCWMVFSFLSKMAACGIQVSGEDWSFPHPPELYLPYNETALSVGSWVTYHKYPVSDLFLYLQ